MLFMLLQLLMMIMMLICAHFCVNLTWALLWWSLLIVPFQHIILPHCELLTCVLRNGDFSFDSTEMWQWPSPCVVLFLYLLQPFHERQLFPVDACAESYCTMRIFLHQHIFDKTVEIFRCQKFTYYIFVLYVIVLYVQAIASCFFCVIYICDTIDTWVMWRDMDISAAKIALYNDNFLYPVACSYQIYAITPPLHVDGSFIAWRINICNTSQHHGMWTTNIIHWSPPPFYSPSCICKYTPFYIEANSTIFVWILNINQCRTLHIFDWI